MLTRENIEQTALAVVDSLDELQNSLPASVDVEAPEVHAALAQTLRCLDRLFALLEIA